MEEIAYMVCMRVEDLETPVEASTTTACVECGCDIWISAASRTHMGQVKAMPVCTQCAERIAKEEENVKTQILGEPTEAQFDEIIQGLRDRGYGELVDAAMDPEQTDIFESMKITSRLAGKAMTDPNEDWGSVAVLQDYDNRSLPPIPLGDMLQKMPKEIIAKRVIPAMAITAEARAVYFGISTWTLKGVDPGDMPEGSLTEHPDHEEALVLMEITADGVTRMATAKILRDGEHGPKLDDWHDVETPEASSGVFVDMLVPTLQLIRSQRDA